MRELACVQECTIISAENNIQDSFRKELLKRELQRRETARSSLLAFTQYTFPAYQITDFHKLYAGILNEFMIGRFKKLIITCPPQHGKSELSTRRLPAFMLGKYRGLRGAICSYSATKVRDFSRDVQRVIAEEKYLMLFPETMIAGAMPAKLRGYGSGDAIRTQDLFEVFDRNKKVQGSLRAVGRGGALTGNPVDFMIMDDLYKDYKEGNSPLIRKAVIDWYGSVVKTRYHNNSQELIVFTRWHEEDLIGHIEKTEGVEILTSYKQLEDIDPRRWYKLNFPALKTGEKTEFDMRELGEALWESQHSRQKLNDYRDIDKEKFESLYQGDPQPLVGLLWQKPFRTYQSHPTFRYIRNYTDSADTGEDFLCSICYGVGIDDNIYILDIVFSQEPQEQTEGEVSEMLVQNKVTDAMIESNNGGRAFARALDRLTKYKLNIEWFHQSENKEARILSNASNVWRHTFFPVNWEGRWPEFYKQITRFKRFFRGNTHDDACDALVGVWENSGIADNESNLWM